MSADTDIYVKVLVGKEKWTRVYAANKVEAKEKVWAEIPDIVRVLEIQYEEPDDFIEHG